VKTHVANLLAFFGAQSRRGPCFAAARVIGFAPRSGDSTSRPLGLGPLHGRGLEVPPLAPRVFELPHRVVEPPRQALEVGLVLVGERAGGTSPR